MLGSGMRGNLGLFVCPADRERLAAIVADWNSLQKQAWRAQVVLLTADRVGTVAIMRQTGLGKPSVWRWQERYIEAGVDGLLARQDAAVAHPAAGRRQGGRGDPTHAGATAAGRCHPLDG